MRAPSRQRGVALVLVMWVAVLLAVVAASFIIERRTETLVVAQFALDGPRRGRAPMPASPARCAESLSRRPDLPRRVEARRHCPTSGAFDGVPVRIEMRDESAKIDINTASDPLLRGLLLSVGLTDDEADKLVDAILDWRDPDSLKRPNGAEEPEYRAAGLSYRPAQRSLPGHGGTAARARHAPRHLSPLAPLITVYSRRPG